VKGLRFTLELLDDPAVASRHHELFLPNARLVSSLSRRNLWNQARATAISTILDRAPFRRILLRKSRINASTLMADDEFLREFVLKCANVQYHVCGTCRIGRTGDMDAVVDPTGRVHGLSALRVVDASIFPSIPRGYPHFIVLMAAEKLADEIKSQRRPNTLTGSIN
jgi:5-(hydroxymethyl)furfural/furfural oxidase